MFISEIFYSVQGEGALTGVPSVFVRTSGCNLRCTWCDTPYASWKPEGTHSEVAEIMEVIQKYPARHVVLTGGEPMIASGIRELAASLRQAGYHITIETAATVLPEGIACDLASMSPKLQNSVPSEEKAGSAWVKRHEETRWRPDVAHAWIQQTDYQFKFVLQTAEDGEEMMRYLKAVECEIPAWKVQIMPEGVTPEALQKRSLELVEFCKNYGFRFANRLHIQLFGNTMGT